MTVNAPIGDGESASKVARYAHGIRAWWRGLSASIRKLFSRTTPAERAPIEAVAPHEQLARYVVKKEDVRKDGTVRSTLFIPSPHVELSVTRHLSLSESGIWQAGHGVAGEMGKSLRGRADITAKVCIDQVLPVIPDPTPANPNHANIIGWPTEKSAQKIKAQELAAKAVYKPVP